MYGIKIESGSNISIPRQICNQIRILIESGELKNGTRLPPTRKIAGELNINRNVLVEVYEQLIAEGYLESRTGSGTFVSSGISRPISRTNTDIEHFTYNRIPKDNKMDLIDFETGIPDLALLPVNLWGKYLKQASESLYHIRENHSIMGDSELRNVLSKYVFRVKGIHCPPEQIVIVAGSSEGFLLTAQALSESFGKIFIEDPTVDFTRNIFSQMNYDINPVTVDRNGMNIPELESQKGRSLILLTPSHQFPTGSILSLQRRLQAIETVGKTDSYIIEDDYDSEFRFKGMPIPPLQVLAPSRVVYVGTFSKTLFPGLRLGFIIVPVQLLEILKKVKDSLNMYTPVIEQKALANFIRDGYIDRHIYKMKNVYKKRRTSLIEYLNKYFGEEIAIIGDEAGMHVQVEFINRIFPETAWNEAPKYGVAVESVEEYCMIKGNNKNKVVLGYGNINPARLEEGVKRLHKFVNDQFRFSSLSTTE